MMLSLVVVAGAEQQTVTLKTAKSVNGSEVTYTFTLDASESDGVGALSFYVATTGLTFKEKVYNNSGKELDKAFKPSTVGQVGQDGAYGFYENMGRFYAYGGDYEANRLLTGSVVLVAVTYTIEDAANYSLEVTEFKACYSGARAMTDDRYNCVIAPIGGGSTGDYDITPVGKGDNTPAYEVEDTSLTVTYSMPCAVAYTTDGVTYTRISATPASDGSYVYDMSALPENAQITVAVKGDLNGDGVVNSVDALLLSRSLIPSTHAAYQELTAVAGFVADVDGSSTINSVDAVFLSRSLVPPTHAAYRALTW